MSVSFRIFPRRGLVYVRYTGFARLQDTFAAFGEYMQHPDCRPGQKQLVDLSEVTGFEPDYAELLKLQAMKADIFAAGGGETLIAYYAPNDAVLRMAELVVRSWEDVPGVVPLVMQTEAEALAVLGQREDSFAALMAQTA